MAQKANLISSILQLKCPKCREGDLFLNKNVYQYKGFFEMPQNCSKCGQDLEIEAGFYYGAMYVSYGLTIAINVAIFVALSVFDVFEVRLFLIVDLIVLLITLPYIFKVSRSIWINMNVSFNKNAILQNDSKK